jgi:hypothetical protein
MVCFTPEKPSTSTSFLDGLADAKQIDRDVSDKTSISWHSEWVIEAPHRYLKLHTRKTSSSGPVVDSMVRQIQFLG